MMLQGIHDLQMMRARMYMHRKHLQVKWNESMKNKIRPMDL